MIFQFIFKLYLERIIFFVQLLIDFFFLFVWEYVSDGWIRPIICSMKQKKREKVKQ